MKRELFAHQSGTTNAGTAVTIATDVCPTTELWEPNFAGLYNQSGESVTAQFAVVRASDTILVSANATVADGTATGTNQLPLIGPGERLGAVVLGTAKAASVTLVVTGIKHSLPLEPVAPSPAA